MKTGPSEAAPGDTITYTLVYSNRGPVKSTNVKLKDYLPPNVTVTGSLNGGSVSGNTITWNLGTLYSKKGGTKTFQVRISSSAPAGSYLTNKTEIDGKEAEEYGKTSNNKSTWVTRLINRVPDADDDAYSVNENTTLNVSAPGVLANDSDPNGHTLKAILVNNPSHGDLNLNGNGSFTYSPDPNFTGTDTFTYKANDGFANSSKATVCITVLPVNDKPVAANDSYNTPEDTVLNIPAPGVLANDSDPDGDVLTALLVSNPNHGSLTFNSDGSFVYQPDSDFAGSDSFTYRANDGQLDGNIATVNITVVPENDPPTVADDSYSTPENTELSIPAPGILANDTDTDGDALKAILVSTTTHGSLALAENGGFVYTPEDDYFGPDSFTYRANDGQENSANTATVTITVTPVNDPPLATDDAYTTAEDVSLTIAAPGVLANDSDTDNDPLIAQLVSDPTHGSVSLNADGSFTYTPATNYTGTDTFTYRANDGQANSATATVTITISPFNDAPAAADDSYSTAEDVQLLIAAPGVLANDSDPDGDALTSILVSQPSHGTLALNGDGSFSYQPDTNFHGLDTFTYRANDGAENSEVATATIRVTPVNNPPDTNQWSGGSFNTLEDVVLAVGGPGVLSGITDADGDELSAILVTNPQHGTLNLNPDGSFSYAPDADYFGPDGFEIRISDGQATSPILTVLLNVLPVNDAPAFIKGGNQLVQQNAPAQSIPAWASNISSGPENEADQHVSFQVDNNNPSLFAQQPAVDSNGALTFAPALNAYGSALVTVIARDDGGTANGGVDFSAPQTFSILVNAPPQISIASPTNGAMFIAPADFTVLAEAHDPDGTVAKVQLFQETDSLAELTNAAPYFVVLTNLPPGSYTFSAMATDNLGATGSAAPVTVTVIERPPLTLLSGAYFNPQNDFFEQRVRVFNPTYSTYNAVRVYVHNLTNFPPITVHNISGKTNGIPYVESHGAVLPGTYVDLVIEFHSPLRVTPCPILDPELVAPSVAGAPVVGKSHSINKGFLMANKTFMVEFKTLLNRVYSVQYSSDLVTWKSSLPAVKGTGDWVQWIDNGQPKTEQSPATQSQRFYRVIELP